MGTDNRMMGAAWAVAKDQRAEAKRLAEAAMRLAKQTHEDAEKEGTIEAHERETAVWVEARAAVTACEVRAEAAKVLAQLSWRPELVVMLAGMTARECKPSRDEIKPLVRAKLVYSSRSQKQGPYYITDLGWRVGRLAVELARKIYTGDVCAWIKSGATEGEA